MIFANTYLRSFGHCKVLSWKSSIYADFERKELTYRGRLLAAVEVPSVRQVEALVLVRGNSAAEVQRKLDEIGSWLYEAGTDKLFSEKDNAHYFLARCTKISIPEYSGNAARITVTFTCTDNRLYEAYNDLPITTSTSEMNNFTFAGKHCLNDMGCVFVLDNFETPAVFANKYEISGMSGTLRYDDGEIRFKERQMTGTLYFVKSTANDGLMDESEITEQLHSISSWLGNAGRGSLVMDNDISREYKAEVVDSATFSRNDWENGSVKLKFIVQPFAENIKYSSTSLSDMVVGPEVGSAIGLGLLVLDGIGATTPLIIDITNTGNATITDLSLHYRDKKNEKAQFRLNGHSFRLDPDETITIDGMAEDIIKNSKSGMKWLKSGNFPALYPNNQFGSIEVSSDGNTEIDITVRCKVRWL